MPTILTRGLGDGVAGHLLTRGLNAGAAALPPTLLAAVKAYWGGAGGLAGSVGPLVAGRANPRTTYPFARVTLVSTRPRYTSTDGYWESVGVQFSVFAGGADAVFVADALGELVRAAFDPKSTRPKLAYAGGVEMTARRTNDTILVEPGTGVGGVANVAARHLSYVFLISRSLS